MSEENITWDRKLYKVVGHNSKLAREISGFSRKDAMQHIWAYRNDNMFPNRVSELESGEKKIELKTVFKMCEVYGCSADFILGFSDEFERNNLAAKYSGMVFQSIRGSVLEATEQLCLNVSKSINHLPPFQGELLKNSSKQLIEVIKRHSHDLAFQGQYSDVIEAAKELEKKVAMFEIFFAKQMRQLELSMMSLLDKESEADEMSSLKLTHDIGFKKPVGFDNAENEIELSKPKKTPEVNVWLKIRKYYESELHPSYEKIKSDLCAEYDLNKFPLESTVKRRIQKEEWSIPKPEAQAAEVIEAVEVVEAPRPKTGHKRTSFDEKIWSKIREHYESKSRPNYEAIKRLVCSELDIQEFPAPRTLRQNATKREWKKYSDNPNATIVQS